jgi:hypothetical protein
MFAREGILKLLRTATRIFDEPLEARREQSYEGSNLRSALSNGGLRTGKCDKGRSKEGGTSCVDEAASTNNLVSTTKALEQRLLKRCNETK